MHSPTITQSLSQQFATAKLPTEDHARFRISPMADSNNAIASAQAAGEKPLEPQPKSELKEVFQDFVGQTFFSEMIKAMRSTQEPSKYLHGGRAEKIFQGQFDQMLSEELSDASADKIADPMYQLFQLPSLR